MVEFIAGAVCGAVLGHILTNAIPRLIKEFKKK